MDAPPLTLNAWLRYDLIERTLAGLRSHYASLTAREKEVVRSIGAGLSNKQIAAEFGISGATVKVHRANIMRKMEARSLADLVRMVDLLRLGEAKAP